MKKDEKKYYYTTIKIHGIKMTVYSSSIGIVRVDLGKVLSKKIIGKKIRVKEDDQILFGVIDELKEYFEVGRKAFSVPLDLRGTFFQLNVWNELMKIPYGDVVAYKDIAERLGNPNLVRAVGRANGANPIPIIIPCHRVIYSNDKLGGYTGGEKIKKKLLTIEGCLSPNLFED